MSDIGRGSKPAPTIFFRRLFFPFFAWEIRVDTESPCATAMLSHSFWALSFPDEWTRNFDMIRTRGAPVPDFVPWPSARFVSF